MIGLYVYIYTYIYTHAHIYIHIYKHTCIFVTHQRDYIYTVWIKSSIQSGMQNSSKLSNVHHYEWTTTAGYWALFCCSVSVRWAWVFALPHPGRREDLTPFKAHRWDLSPLLDHITVNACLYVISLYTFISRYNGHKLQCDWSCNKQIGDLQMLIFVFSHHNSQQHFVDPQPELKAVSPIPMGQSSSFGPWHFPWKSESCFQKLGDVQELSTRKKDWSSLLPSYPPIRAKSLHLHQQNKKEKLQLSSCEYTACFFPPSHLAPARAQSIFIYYEQDRNVLRNLCW